MITTPQKSKQQGAVLILFMAGALVLIGMAGLVLDMGHAYLNKTRLQNALDAAALSGAKTLNDGSDINTAGADALSTFNAHLEGEMGDANLVPIIQFSQTLIPFIPGAIEPNARYVRVKVENFQTAIWFASVLPNVGSSQNITGSAVAGPSPPLGTGGGEVCDIAPLLMCGDPADTDCSDGTCFGYAMGNEEEIVLKTHASNKKNGWEVGPGNYQLVELDCGPGSDCVRESLAGGYSGCATQGETITTKPGNSVGPVAQGFNTRFASYQGGMSSSDYPSDTVTYHSSTFWYADYLDRQQHGPLDQQLVSQGGIGVPMRRVMTVPIGRCDGTTNGHGEVEVLGFGCFFMTKPTSHSGNTQSISGQFIDNCSARGSVGENPPGPGNGPYLFKIILYKDPDAIAS